MLHFITALTVLQLINVISSISVNPIKLEARQNGVEVVDRCNKGGSFSLTFDDGPSQYSLELNNLLKRDGAIATFFMNGNNAACIYDQAEMVKQRFQDGHLIANHGWSHAHMSSLSREQQVEEIGRVEEAMIKILGVKPLYFRPPYGEYNQDTLDILSERGYRALVLWNQDSGDSFASPPSADQTVSEYEGYQAQDIVLNHELSRQTVQDVMPRVIPRLQQRGFQLETVGQCLSMGTSANDWYSRVGAPGQRDSTWSC